MSSIHFLFYVYIFLLLIFLIASSLFKSVSVALQASKLSTEDCMVCVDLIEVLIVEHFHRFILICVA